EATRRRVAVISQDFVRYHASLRDNVVLGTADQLLVEQALTDAGGAALPDRLERSWNTVLSAEYDGGTDLSGGQWQRVALARALAAVAGGAGILVLDEPTAALDVRAEAALFERFLEVTRGVTTILVSHRLSSVRHADRIVVLAGPGDLRSGIVEDGTHEELLALGGRYAELFTLQASRFAGTGSVPR
ncbi:MAG TPA: ABC transporter ATP-binding protein, partial [Kribbella sp.]|nr:ABC transporter ATP-binding protein [Kribbella sp.]